MSILRKSRSRARYLVWLGLTSLVTGGMASLYASSTTVVAPTTTTTKAADPSAPRTAVPVASAASPTAFPHPPDVGHASVATSRLRDPFRAPEEVKAPSAAVDPAPAKPRPPGVHGLQVDQLRLQGVVREDISHRMLAVVVGQKNLSYFVREGDELYDGQVTRITPDAVYIRRTGSGAVPGPREIALRLAPGAGGQP